MSKPLQKSVHCRIMRAFRTAVCIRTALCPFPDRIMPIVDRCETARNRWETARNGLHYAQISDLIMPVFRPHYARARLCAGCVCMRSNSAKCRRVCTLQYVILTVCTSYWKYVARAHYELYNVVHFVVVHRTSSATRLHATLRLPPRALHIPCATSRSASHAGATPPWLPPH